jgi:protein phosphatase
LWDELSTSWVCLDMELMPWSAKAGELLERQYAAVGDAAARSFGAALPVFAAARQRGLDVQALDERVRTREELVERYRQAYRQYCWELTGPEDLRAAPFHVLASEGQVHIDKPHSWHMDTVRRMVAEDDRVVMATRTLDVSLEEPASRQRGIDWWTELTSGGGEGMVVKPMQFVARHKDRLVQPAVKVRGPDYLRIIYGPDYTLPENLSRLRERSLGMKRSLALREFALGIEALSRFVSREGLYRVHECVFGVLALESEPVDPRL